jgi:hypothetical protein
LSLNIWARPSQKSDIESLDRWLRETPQNLFDVDILQYSHDIRFLTATRAGTPLVHMPIQTVSMLESLAVSPDASEGEIAVAVRELVHAAVANGANEVYWICKDENVNRLAERHGCERMLTDPTNGTLWRIKVAKL